ncbi:hypothetical protein L210DRAFT_2409621 [Boletus edulis BED1]|uniref:WKF domain-containing protein n=1 Tax=Boletus edulis BED1 TaxID=1328754 RepID=A0AAD4GKK7_BOLED|nr:hypothetical protein L210DRAFT_2409621 [Boletus edulis BED1]
MSGETVKRFTKNHRNSEKEEKGLKAKKDRKSRKAENSVTSAKVSRSLVSQDLSDSTSTQRVGDQPASRKRKRIDRDAIRDQPVDLVTDAPEFEPPPKKRDGYQEEDGVHHLPYPDPAIDESLAEQSRRALSYAYERCRGIETWKFNKARQNWLLRNVWSEQAVSRGLSLPFNVVFRVIQVPENYIPLVIGYLAGISGGAREKLIEECISKTSTSEKAPMQAQPSNDDSSKVGSTIIQQSDTSRAQSILQVLRKNT